MTSTFLRPTLLLVVVAALSACGGKATFTVGGDISNLQYDGLQLSNLKNNDTITVAKGATSYTLPTTIEYGTEYQVVVKTQPAHQTCAINEFVAKDTAGRLATINVAVGCAVNAYSVGGKISGLTVDGLVLVNGSTDRITVAKGAVVYAFPNNVTFGNTYSIAVLTSPAGLKCSVVNGVGTMGTAGDAAVTNIDVTCVPV